HMDIYLPYEDYAVRVIEEYGRIKGFQRIDPLTGQVILNEVKNPAANSQRDPSASPQDDMLLDEITLYPAKLYLMDPVVFDNAEKQIRADLEKEYNILKKQNKLLEAERLLRKVNYDLEMIKEVGYVNGIENYSRYFDGRKPGDPPYSLLDYFKVA